MPMMRWAFLLTLVAPIAAAQPLSRVVVSENRRFLQRADGTPFFWLADTGWLLFQKLDRAETERYLEDRRRKGFNVIQAMVLHSGDDRNVFGAAALIENDPSRPDLAGGDHGYWQHIDWVVDLAAAKGIYVAMVPAWGSIIKRGQVNERNAAAYARFLAQRYGAKPNIFWLNGGDLQGDVKPEVWQTIGRTLKEADPAHLMTFHPFGRTQSSTWFQGEPWLDFNMFQSGHRRYDQDTATPAAKGEDNWRYVFEDLTRTPPKPTLDGEPSYEGIPQGLHDPKEPRWQDHDARRYAYWSVFAGACGHTYGNNAVMQMRKPGETKSSYGAVQDWAAALDDPGAGQMQHLKNLILARPYFERVNADNLILKGSGPRYARVTVTRGRGFVLVYAYLGRPFTVRLGATSGRRVRAQWYSPRDGQATPIGLLPNQGVKEFTPPAAGRDWVLALDDVN